MGGRSISEVAALVRSFRGASLVVNALKYDFIWERWIRARWPSEGIAAPVCWGGKPRPAMAIGSRQLYSQLVDALAPIRQVKKRWEPLTLDDYRFDLSIHLNQESESAEGHLKEVFQGTMSATEYQDKLKLSLPGWDIDPGNGPPSSQFHFSNNLGDVASSFLSVGHESFSVKLRIRRNRQRRGFPDEEVWTIDFTNPQWSTFACEDMCCSQGPPLHRIDEGNALCLETTLSSTKWLNGLCRIRLHDETYDFNGVRCQNPEFIGIFEDLPLKSFDLRLSLGLQLIFPPLQLRGFAHTSTSIRTVNMSFLYRLGLDASAWSYSDPSTYEKLSNATKHQHAVGCDAYYEHEDYDIDDGHVLCPSAENGGFEVVPIDLLSFLNNLR
jgi:hypothetical protein